jgi:hypothetical protein
MYDPCINNVFEFIFSKAMIFNKKIQKNNPNQFIFLKGKKHNCVHYLNNLKIRL